MSSHDSDPELVELSLQFAGLDITIRGPSSQAADFVQRLSGSASSVVPDPVPELSPAPSASEPVRPPTVPVEESFEPCPDSVHARARTFLKSTRVAPEARASRAWLAGQWAKACISGRVSTVPKTPSLDFPTKYWVVLRSPRCQTPRLFQTFALLEREAGSLDSPGTIGHGFPTETEAFFYLESSGFKNQVQYYN